VGGQDIISHPRQGHVIAEGCAKNDIGIVSLNAGKDTPLQDIQ
jgi:hypothetical protein